MDIKNFKEYVSTINKCKYCGSVNLAFTLRPDTPHYGELRCGHCKTWNCWVKNPNSPKANSPRINKQEICDVSKFHEFNDEFCFMCLRTKNQLGLNETLTVDHIKELGAGGFDVIQNMQILCSACHKLKNWTRLYMNWHLNGKEGENEKTI